MPNLHSAIHDLAQSFTSAVLDAIRAASLDDLHIEGNWVSSHRTTHGGSAQADLLHTPTRKPTGRLPRRSHEDIAKRLDQVVGLVKASKTGLRAARTRRPQARQEGGAPRARPRAPEEETQVQGAEARHGLLGTVSLSRVGRVPDSSPRPAANREGTTPTPRGPTVVPRT
jgi:hypothetical protein